MATTEGDDSESSPFQLRVLSLRSVGQLPDRPVGQAVEQPARLAGRPCGCLQRDSLSDENEGEEEAAAWSWTAAHSSRPTVAPSGVRAEILTDCLSDDSRARCLRLCLSVHKCLDTASALRCVNGDVLISILFDVRSGRGSLTRTLMLSILTSDGEIWQTPAYPAHRLNDGFEGREQHNARFAHKTSFFFLYIQSLNFGIDFHGHRASAVAAKIQRSRTHRSGKFRCGNPGTEAAVEADYSHLKIKPFSSISPRAEFLTITRVVAHYAALITTLMSPRRLLSSKE